MFAPPLCPTYVKVGFRGVFWALHTKNAHKKEKELQPFSYNSCLLFGAEGGIWHVQNKACSKRLLFLKNNFSHSHFVYNFVAHPSQVFRTRTVPQNALSSDTGTARLSACSFLNLPCKPADAHGRYAVTSILLSQSVTLLASPARPRVSASHRG